MIVYVKTSQLYAPVRFTDLEIERSAIGIYNISVETTFDELFPVVGSKVVPVMNAVLVIVQTVPTTRPVIVIDPVAPFAIFPALSVNTRPLNEPAEAYNPVNPFERVSVIIELVEVYGQRFP